MYNGMVPFVQKFGHKIEVTSKLPERPTVLDHEMHVKAARKTACITLLKIVGCLAC